MAERAAHLVDDVFPIVPVRQWVFSLPHRLTDSAPRGRLCQLFSQLGLDGVSRSYYSARSAATLFVRVARMAGIQLATAAARQSAKVVTA